MSKRVKLGSTSSGGTWLNRLDFGEGPTASATDARRKADSLMRKALSWNQVEEIKRDMWHAGPLFPLVGMALPIGVLADAQELLENPVRAAGYEAVAIAYDVEDFWSRIKGK